MPENISDEPRAPGNGGSEPPDGGTRSTRADPPAPQGSVLSLSQLIGAPINALVEAEAQAAMATARFIRMVGFTGNGDDMNALGELQMARFNRRRRTKDGKIEDVEVQIPLLSMLPIPALQIRDAELDYTVRILQTEAIQPADGAQESLTRRTPEGEPIARLRASFAREPRPGDRRSTDMLVKMKLRIEQADMPNGLAQLLALASESSQQEALLPAPQDTDAQPGEKTGEKG
ncbi:MAG: DUF2589 domain-containing protein [Chromatiales bacterium]|nr:DUF2589 domain-containing protein [Chromatiales bacterium]